ncbi:carcinoembryonic antigen-related cell adhesion molecule 20-like [Antechinus flavipes]|uniref:carcinoembryonic antigen-related cell adhesion molecule 20-like n=1 Tax=Antechinus flavipes TaxID=38775 RepID=UPI0022364740|nr:carcinoembryonic antigen-related cell adhesion molecule 20-like [Antechinus flavipes]
MKCEIPDTSRVITHLNGSLTLTDLSSKDSGFYLVKVGTFEKNPYWSEKRIQVIDEPIALQLTLNADYNQKSAIEIKVNSTIAFYCQIKSHPVTSYRWTLNGHNLNHTGNQLTLHNVSWAHQGIYTCSSHNKQAKSFNSAKVTLRVDWGFASASSSTPSEKTYQDLDVTEVDVYDQIIHPRRKMFHR